MKKTIIIDGVKIRYTDTGNGHPVLCIHGNPGCAEDFSGNGTGPFRMIALDRPGHGESGRYPYKADHTTHQIRIIHSFAQALGLSTFTLAAHSWGCFIALSYALEYLDDVTSILLMAPLVYPRTQAKTARPGLVKIMQLPVLGKPVTSLLAFTAGKSAITKAMESGFSPEPMPTPYTETILPRFFTPDTFRHVCEDKSDFEYSIMEACKRYAGITAKTLLVCGEKDMTVDNIGQAGKLQNVLPDSRLVTIPNAGHQIPQLYPGTVIEKLMELQGI